MYACEREENANDSPESGKSSQSTACADTDYGTLTAAGVVRHSKEM